MLDNERCLLDCIYRPHMLDSINTITKSITYAKHLITTKYDGLLVCGDFNLPPIKWNNNGVKSVKDTNINSLANQFIDCLSDAYLTQFVTDPTFQADEITSTSTLDLIIAECNEKIKEIFHLPPLANLKKGHHVLTFLFKTKSMPQPKFICKKMFHSTNYELMSDFFTNCDWRINFENRNVNECYDAFLKYYNIACDKYVKIKYVKTNYKSCNWISLPLKIKMKSKNKLWFKCLACGFSNAKLVEEYKQSKITYKRLLKKTVKEYELKLAINAKHNPKLLYSYVKQKKKIKSSINSLKDKSDCTITDSKDIANTLNDHFQDVFTKNDVTEVPKFEKRTNNICGTPLFDFNLVYNILVKLDPNKSAGPDGVSPICICPDDWKSAHITPLYKKGSKLITSKYRPISLMSVVSKVMEKIVNNSLVQHLVQNHLTSTNQHGFVHNKSCTTNLIETMDFITYSLSKGNAVDVVFMDFAKAFDVVPHRYLIHKLSNYGIIGHTLKWLESFLKNC
ncbi:uncharacterized protein LOC124816078 [Hydra vulgaris]|uniref:uncharacterized protein LOC124816078 n=1 Tax=Hydra vulgaris TaxID=6087 RepID=UPI001F5F5657|nr:uncharacterized protein LOC124816078 [Hydra vulgaris]